MGIELKTNPWVTDQVTYQNQIEAEMRNRLKALFGEEGAKKMLDQFTNDPYFQFSTPQVDINQLQPYDAQTFTPTTGDPHSFDINAQGVLAGLSPKEIRGMISAQGFDATAGTIGNSQQLTDWLAGKGKLSPEVLAQINASADEAAGRNIRDTMGALELQGSASGFGQSPGFYAPLKAEMGRRSLDTAAEAKRQAFIGNEQLGLANQGQAIGWDVGSRQKQAELETQAGIASAGNKTNASMTSSRNMADYLSQYGGLLSALARANQGANVDIYGRNLDATTSAGLTNARFLNDALSQNYAGRLSAMLKNPELDLESQQLRSNYGLNRRNQNLSFLDLYRQAFNPAPYAQTAANLAPQTGQFINKPSTLGSILGAGLGMLSFSPIKI